MAIKFGDILQNQNSSYPIVEASNNDIKGVIFSTGLPAAGDFSNKRALGTILVDTSADKMYFYKGADLTNGEWGTNSNWEVLATGTGETIQTTDLPVSIPTGRSFGRFVNGDTIDVGSGESAMQIIIDAITAYVAPTGGFTNSSSDVGYSTSSQSVTHSVTFTVRNENQAVVAGNTTSSAFAIREVKLLRKLGSGDYTEIANATPSVNDFAAGTFSDLNTQGTVTAETFNFADTISVGSGSADFTYKVVITPNDGAGNATTDVEIVGADGNSGFIDCAAYNSPNLNSDSYARQNTSSHFVGDAETDSVREKGNVATKLTFKVKCDTPLVPITNFQVKRSINGGSAVTIFNSGTVSISGTSSEYKIFDSITTGANNVTGLNGTPTGFTDVSSAFPGSDTDCNTVAYSISFTDAEQTSTDTFNGGTINFEFPALVGYSTQGGSNNDPSTLTDAQMSTAINAIRSGSSNDRRQYEILNTSGTGDPDFGAGISLTPSGSQFTYIAFPATYSEIDTFQKPNTPDEYGSFGSDPRSTTVDFTTHYGVTNSNYEVYVSNSAGAFNGTYTIN